MTGTGFMKSSPMNLCGRSVTAASRVIERDEVFVVSTVRSARSGVRSRRIRFLTSSFSVAHSITRSAAPMGSSAVATCTRSSTLSRSSALIVPLVTARPVDPAIRERAASSCDCDRSLSRTS